MRNLFFCIVAVLLTTSCVTEKKAFRYMREHPIKLADLCSETYPPKIEYRPGKPIVKTDSIIIEKTDTIKVTVDCPDGTKVKADCPPNKTITKTIRDSITIVDTIEIESTQAKARIDYLQKKLAELESQNSDLRKDNIIIKEDAKTSNKWNWILGSILVIGVGWRLVRFFRVI